MDDVVKQQPIATDEKAVNALDYLAKLDFVKIRQRIDVDNSNSECEVQNGYDVTDGSDVVFITITEESEPWQRIFCSQSQRALVLHILDKNGQELAQIKKSFKCCGGASWCCGADCGSVEMFVDRPSSHTFARVKQMFYCCFPKFHMFDEYGKQQYEMTGPFFSCQGPGCHDDLEYPLRNAGGSDSGVKVTKIWDGSRTCSTNTKIFGIHFPADMEVQKKLSLFGAVFALDYCVFGGNDE